MKYYYIRDPIHGFIELTEWEMVIINRPEFQRLRRIKQLSLSEMVYPATTHTRFEHSLGVMHVATQMFDNIVQRNKKFLQQELNYDDTALERQRILIRFASLLHDIGHAPFSHAGEELMPYKSGSNAGEGKQRYKHEDYSIAIIDNNFKEYIDDYKYNYLKITTDEICELLKDGPSSAQQLFWRNLISSQLDADRADYLLRDSYHAGVNYGKYDLKRILRTLTIVKDPETENYFIGIDRSGWHAAEGLIIARYQMFSQVYFQHTRKAYDHHITEILRTLLEETRGESVFPPPTKEYIDEYLDWDDWKVVGLIKEGKAGSEGDIILNRNHHRRVYETSEVPDIDELSEFEAIVSKFEDEIAFVDLAEKSWYKKGDDDIPIVEENNYQWQPLSEYSSIVKNLAPCKQKRIYVPYVRKDRVKAQIERFREELKNGKKL
ncbi:MAG: HD domain-containing protein [Caldicoprobacterales bacterium]